MSTAINADDAIGHPLRGITVLDLSRLLPGPAASLRLAQMGAKVIKIEQPGEGDYARVIGPIKHQVSQFFISLNQDKEFLRLDLKSAEGHQAFLRLLETADVVLESFRPGVMEKLGLGWPTLRALRPQLVMCAISGYGCDGPYAELAGHDLNYIALSGVLQQNVGSDGVPTIPNLQIGDLLGGAQQAIAGILAALLAVKMGGCGRFIDISMTDGVLANNFMPRIAINGLANSELAQISNAQLPQAGKDLLTGGVPCYQVYRCADQRFLALGALELKFWQNVCAVLGRPDLAKQHWMCGQEIGGEQAQLLKQELDAIFISHTLDHWLTLFADKDCCVSPVLSMQEALAHPLFTSRNMVQRTEHATEGAFWQTGSGIRFLA